MKNLVLTFGILSVVLLQATALPGSPSSPKPGNSDEDSQFKDLCHNTTEPLRKFVKGFQSLFRPLPSIPRESWCKEVLDQLTDEEREIGMELFVIALCEKNSDSDEPSDSIRLLTAALSELPPKKLLPYVEGILKQWGYIIHKDYQAALGPEVRSEIDIEGPKESSSGQSHTVNDSEETGHNQNVNRGPLGLHYFKDQSNNVQPMSDNQFEVTWVDIFKASDLDLLRRSPLLLMFKHEKFFDLRRVYLNVWEALPQGLLKGPGSVLEPVATSYPIYFHSGVDNSGAQVDESNSVWHKNICFLLAAMGAPFSLAVPLLHGDYDRLRKTLGLLKDDAQSQPDKVKKDIAYALYFMTQKLIPNVQDKVNQVLTEFLGEGEFNEMEAGIKKKGEYTKWFENPLLKIMQNLVRGVDNGKVEVAIVDIHSST
ncbi:hypothetical protein IWQ61_001158 [Dispira simplex]|nr:hypothetical protein IWQ61_001158 [Dispira simplex]